MKKIAALLIGLGLSVGAFAQQQDQFSQYMMNYYLINPAIGGVEGYADIKLGYRNQWTGFSGAPKNYYVSAHMPIGRLHETHRKSYRKRSLHHSVGVLVTGQKLGEISHNGAYASYGVHLPLSKKWTLSLAGSAGAQMYMVDHSKLDYGDGQGVATDDIVMSASNRTNFDLNLGIWAYSDKVFLGVSSLQLLSNKLSFAPGMDNAGVMSRHFYITGGYDFKINRELSFVPSALVKLTLPQAAQLDINAKIRYDKWIWFGAGWRRQDAIVLLAGVLINNMWEIGYSYDITTSHLRKFSYGSHEIMVGVRLSRDPIVICPSNFW